MKDAIIIEWFKAWFDPQWKNFKTIFDPNVYYSESWGPEYYGTNQVETWFNEWHENFKLNKWTIKQIIHSTNYTTVEWIFCCSDLDGLHEFDGLSLIEWNNQNQIKSLKEFASSLPKYNPLEEENI